MSDLLHSCAHESVAEAAIASIGGAVAARAQAEAEARGIRVGVLVASRVRNFSRTATERDWRDLAEAVRGQDFPVLSGLRVILAAPKVLEPANAAA